MSARKEQPPTVEVVDRAGMPRERHSHPAFAMVGAARMTGSTHLYGSDFVHRSWISIKLRRSTMDRDLSHDWYHGGSEMVEVWLSEAQWATMLSSLNAGDGVPCTLSFEADKGYIPRISQPRDGAADFVREAKTTLAETIAKVDEVMANIQEELDAGRISKKRGEAMTKPLYFLRQDLEANMPYVARSFGKYMEERVEKGKLEIHAYAERVLRDTGVAALAAGVDVRPIALPEGDADD